MDSKSNDSLNEKMIYMSIDHLKKGVYTLNVLENGKVIKSIKIKKQ